MQTITLPVGTTLAQAFPDDVTDVEKIVYQHVLDAAAPGAACKLPYYSDGRPNQPGVTVSQGWPAYPGKIPAIGVAEGTESEDQAQQTLSGGLVDDVVAYDTNGALIGSASYFSEPLYTPIVVILIHENRDERDRLHNQLRLVMTSLRRSLPAEHPRIRMVNVDAEKSEVSGGPPAADKPFLIYTSVFTVHTHQEILQAENVSSGGTVVISPITQVDLDVKTVDPTTLASYSDDE